jgi:hypothetical protein
MGIRLLMPQEDYENKNGAFAWAKAPFYSLLKTILRL